MPVSLSGIIHHSHDKLVSAFRISRPPRPLRRLRAGLWSCLYPGRRGRNGEMHTVQRELNEDLCCSLDGQTPKNTASDVGHGRRSKRSCQTLRRVSQKATLRNANLRAFVLGNNSGPKNRSLVRQVLDGWTQTWQHYDEPGTDSMPWRKRISNHSTRKSVVAKLKRAGQPRHKIIQITGHANESSLDDYDEIDWRRRKKDFIPSGYSGAHTKTTIVETAPSSSSSTVLPSSAAAIDQRSAQSFTHQSSYIPPQMPVNRTFSGPAVQHFNNCTVNIQTTLRNNRLIKQFFENGLLDRWDRKKPKYSPQKMKTSVHHWLWWRLNFLSAYCSFPWLDHFGRDLIL